MQCVKKSVLVPYASAEMFDLVDRVEQYPQFLPWCAGAQVLAAEVLRKSARLDIDYLGVRARSDTPLRDGDRIEILRPLPADPKELRRRRAARSRANNRAKTTRG